MTGHRSRRAIAAVGLAAVLVAACGDDDSTTTDTTDETTPSTTSTTSEPTTTGDPEPGALPGEVIEIFPYEGAAMAVVGVEADDVLNVRAGPGVDFDVVATLDPLSDGEAVATGTNRQLDGGAIWAEVEIGDAAGWANTAFLLQRGVTDDVTASLYPPEADVPSAETLTDLAEIVAAELASEEPPTEVVVVDGPTVADLGEITVDVVGVPDDATGAFRLHIFAEEGDEEFVLRTVERTDMCRRGVDAEGRCH